jgi:hypothetical protein
VSVLFQFSEIDVVKHPDQNYVVARGDIINKSGKDFNSVVFQLNIFLKNTSLGNTKVVMNGFRNGQRRRFEKPVENLAYSKIAGEALRYEIAAESWY